MNPFKFGTIVENDFFTDRNIEFELSLFRFFVSLNENLCEHDSPTEPRGV